MNIEISKNAKNYFQKDFANYFQEDFAKLMNNSDFRKHLKNVKKHRDIKLVATNKERNYLVSEPNYHTTKRISKNILAIEMKTSKSSNE